MPESMYKPTADLSTSAPSLKNEQDGTAITVSPTGAPVVPVNLVPWLVGVVGVAGVLAHTLPPHTIAAQICGLVFQFGGLLGLASPGVRKQ